MHDFKTLEEVLKKYQQMEIDIDFSTPTEKGRLE